MAENSGISWTTHTFNTHWGCTKVSDECKHCYADTLSARFGDKVWGPLADRKPMSEKYWNQIAKWNKLAATADEPPRIFCCSMADVFEGPETCQNPNAYAVVQAGRDRLFKEIEKAPYLDFLLLTKRPENMIKFAPESWADSWPRNIWAGTSVGNQAAADKRIPLLLKVPAHVRFLSIEPLLGPVQLGVGCEFFDYGVGRDKNDEPRIHWVIVGGESGPGARPMDEAWARSIRDDCRNAEVAFFMKQMGGVRDKRHDFDQIPEDLRIREYPEAIA